MERGGNKKDRKVAYQFALCKSKLFLRNNRPDEYQVSSGSKYLQVPPKDMPKRENEVERGDSKTTHAAYHAPLLGQSVHGLAGNFSPNTPVGKQL